MENADKIVGALRCCGNTDTKKPDCEHCPLQSTRMCVKVMLEGAAYLIEFQQSHHIAEMEAAQKEISDLKEYEKLYQDICDKHQETFHKMKSTVEQLTARAQPDNKPLTPDKLQAMNSLEIVDSSICGDEVEYVCAEISAANLKTLLDAGFTTEQIDEAMGDDKTDIDLATLAFNHTDAVWWDSERGFTAAQAGEDDNANEKKTVV